MPPQPAKKRRRDQHNAKKKKAAGGAQQQAEKDSKGLACWPSTSQPRTRWTLWPRSGCRTRRAELPPWVGSRGAVQKYAAGVGIQRQLYAAGVSIVLDVCVAYIGRTVEKVAPARKGSKKRRSVCEWFAELKKGKRCCTWVPSHG